MTDMKVILFERAWPQSEMSWTVGCQEERSQTNLTRPPEEMGSSKDRSSIKAGPPEEMS